MAFSVNPRDTSAATISRSIQASAPAQPPSYSSFTSSPLPQASSSTFTHHPAQLNDSLPPAYTPRDPSSENSHAPINELSSTGLPFRSSDYINESKTHLLLCASGSVATIKIPLICHALSPYHSTLSIRLILTPSASQFLQGQSEEQPSLQDIAQIAGVEGIYTDEDEWAHPWSRTSPAGSVPILHIELRKWADIMVIAPLSANTMAKIVGGQADGLLTSVVRAWDMDASVDGLRENYKRREEERIKPVLKQGRAAASMRGMTLERKKILVCPAMNTAMWRQPITKKQINLLKEEFTWVEVLSPTSKELACGDVGDGAMIDWRDIVKILKMRCCLEPIGDDKKNWGVRRKILGYVDERVGNDWR